MIAEEAEGTPSRQLGKTPLGNSEHLGYVHMYLAVMMMQRTWRIVGVGLVPALVDGWTADRFMGADEAEGAEI